MFGNLQGWIVSAALALGFSWLLYFVAMPPTPTSPSGAKVMSVAFKPIAPAVAPDTIVKPGTKEGGSELYHHAIDELDQHEGVYDQAEHNLTKSNDRNLPAIGMLIKARDYGDVRLFSGEPSTLVNYGPVAPSLESLHRLGTICCSIGSIYVNKNYLAKNRKTNPEESRKYLEAGFVLGNAMFNERLNWVEESYGYDLMVSAAAPLKTYYTIKKDSAKADAIDAFLNDIKDYQDKLSDAIKIITGVSEPDIGGYAGDIFAIALSDDADPLFRIEAIKHIGRYRYNSVSKGDQFRARRVVQTYADDPKLNDAKLAPFKTAVIAARDLTQEQYNKFGN